MDETTERVADLYTKYPYPCAGADGGEKRVCTPSASRMIAERSTRIRKNLIQLSSFLSRVEAGFSRMRLFELYKFGLSHLWQSKNSSISTRTVGSRWGASIVSK